MNKVKEIYIIIKKSFLSECHAMFAGGREVKRKKLEDKYSKKKTMIPKFLYINVGLIWYLITRKKIFKNTTAISWNIYNIKDNMGDYLKQYNWIHYFFKYKFFVPLLSIARLILKKYYIKEIPDEPYYRNLKVFRRAYEKAQVVWRKYYMFPFGGEQCKPEKLKEYLGPHFLTDIKELITLFALTPSKKIPSEKQMTKFANIKDTMKTNDSAYLEFFNILMFCIWEEMVLEFKEDKKIKHLLYHSRHIFDVEYLLVWKCLAKEITSGKDIVIYEARKELNGYTMTKVGTDKVNKKKEKHDELRSDKK